MKARDGYREEPTSKKKTERAQRSDTPKGLRKDD
jgi:hypothetical protein